jgi:ABC-type multidrug transport system ATPase subunit
MPQSIGTLKYSLQGIEIPVDEVFTHISIATPYMELIEEFTLLEQLRFHFSLKPARNGLSEAEILEKMSLAHAKDKYISNFSSGMKQRVKLALAFFSEADILFLDEPGTNLDSQAFDWYLRNLEGLIGKCLVFIASNQPSEYPFNAQKIDIMSYK